MKIIIEIPDGYIANDCFLNNIQNGSIACGQILKAVKNGKPYEERPQEAIREKIYGDGYQDGHRDGYDKGYDDAQALYKRPTSQRVNEIIEELESRKDYGPEYAQAMEDAIIVLKAILEIDKERENE